MKFDRLLSFKFYRNAMLTLYMLWPFVLLFMYNLVN